MKLYQISGLGANQLAFENLKLRPEIQIEFLPWINPEKNELISHYAERISAKINPNEDFALMGLSFGGIMVNEINQFLKPKHNILLSTVKSRDELPAFMKLSSSLNAHKLIPMKMFQSEQVLSYALFRKLYNRRAENIDHIFEFRSPEYLKWSIHQIVNWKEKSSIQNFTHIHGTKDNVFPIKNIKGDIKSIKNGSHIMVMHKPKEISNIINESLIGSIGAK